MLAAGALGGYFAYKLGYDAELANFENQYYASVSQLQYSVQRGLSAKQGAGALAAAYFASAAAPGSTFPNVSYPGWNAIAYNLNIVAQVRPIFRLRSLRSARAHAARRPRLPPTLTRPRRRFAASRGCRW